MMHIIQMKQIKTQIFYPFFITTLVSIKVVNETIVVTNETKPIGKNSL